MIKDFFKKLIDENGAMFLLGNSSCPCGQLEMAGVKIVTHCWRSNCEDEHPYSCVHISQDQDMDYKKGELKAVAKMFADYIEENYRTEVTIKLPPNKGRKEI